MLVFFQLINNVLADHCLASITGQARTSLKAGQCLDHIGPDCELCCRFQSSALKCQVEGEVTTAGAKLPEVSNRSEVQDSENITHCFVQPGIRQCYYETLKGYKTTIGASLAVPPGQCSDVFNEDLSQWKACCDEGPKQDDGQAPLICRSGEAYNPNLKEAPSPAIDQVPVFPFWFEPAKPWYGGVYCYQKEYHAP